MVMECINGPINHIIKEIGKMMNSMAKASTHGTTVEDIQDFGRIILCMATVNCFMKTVEVIRDNTRTTKNTAKVYIPGQMVRDMTVDGKMESNMEKPPSQRLLDSPKWAYGIMVNV